MANVGNHTDSDSGQDCEVAQSQKRKAAEQSEHEDNVVLVGPISNSKVKAKKKNR